MGGGGRDMVAQLNSAAMFFKSLSNVFYFWFMVLGKKANTNMSYVSPHNSHFLKLYDLIILE